MAFGMLVGRFVTSEPDIPPRFGDYEVLSRIAEGGMGAVFRARDGRNGRLVAIKTARSARPEDAAALRREISVLRGVDDRGIVRICDDGVWDGGPWMAMELLEGRTLCRVMASLWPDAPRLTAAGTRFFSDELPTEPVFGRARPVRGAARRPAGRPLSAGGRLAEVFAIFGALCRAVDRLHERGIVHRDLKPANVMVGDDGRVTLLDFGLACANRDDLAPDVLGGNICIGTMEYAAPEQICGEPVDARADIYSLGCMLYELATGRRPFEGVSIYEIARLQVHDDPRAPSELVADLPCALEALLLQMLAKRPEDRPGSAAEVGWRLGRIARRRAAEPGPRLDFSTRLARGETNGGEGMEGRASGRTA
jgi:serine/threonine protein kinase